MSSYLNVGLQYVNYLNFLNFTKKASIFLMIYYIDSKHLDILIRTPLYASGSYLRLLGLDSTYLHLKIFKSYESYNVGIEIKFVSSSF